MIMLFSIKTIEMTLFSGVGFELSDCNFKIIAFQRFKNENPEEYLNTNYEFVL